MAPQIMACNRSKQKKLMSSDTHKQVLFGERRSVISQHATGKLELKPKIHVPSGNMLGFLGHPFTGGRM